MVATKSYKMGPGTLTVGAGPLALEQQLANARVEWSESVSGGTDDLDLLNGNVLEGDDGTPSYAATLAGNLVQDISAAGAVAWSWANKGTEQPFTFIPNATEARKVTGVCVPVPITVGGDVKTTPRADFTWRCIGSPVLAAV